MTGRPDSLADLQEELRRFRDDRDWAQFHSLKNLAAAVSIEAAELQELFLWANADDEAEILDRCRGAVEDEVADVLIQLLNFAAIADVDVLSAARAKVDR